MAHAIRIRGNPTVPLHADVRQYLVDEEDRVIGRMHVRRSGEVHMVWDSGDRLVCCWTPSSGALGFDASAEFRLWTYRAYENVHECLSGERALRAAHHYFSCTEYTGGGQGGVPEYLAREWWERWRDEGSASPASASSEAGPSRHKRTASRSHPYSQQQGQAQLFYRPRTADRAGSMSSDSSLSSELSPAVRRTVLLDPHVNERIRRLESALIWHSNILERIVHCRHHECAHADDEGDPKGVKGVAGDDKEELGSKLRRLESLSGDIDLKLKRIQLCEGCA